MPKGITRAPIPKGRGDDCELSEAPSYPVPRAAVSGIETLNKRRSIRTSE